MIESCMMMCGLFGDEPWWTLYMEHSPCNLTYLFSHQLMVCWCLLSSNAVSLIHNYTNDKKLFVNTSWDVCSDWRAVWICLSFPMVLLIQAMQSRIASLGAWILYFRSNVVNSRRLSRRKSIEFHSKSCQWLRKSCTGTFMYFYTPSSHILTVVYCSLVGWRNRQLEAHVYRRLQAVYSCFQGTFASSILVLFWCFCCLLHQRLFGDLSVEVMLYLDCIWMYLVMDELRGSNPCQCFFFCKISKDWAWKNTLNLNGLNFKHVWICLNPFIGLEFADGAQEGRCCLERSSSSVAVSACAKEYWVPSSFSHSSHCSTARPPYSSRQPNPHRYLMYVLWRHLADLTSRRPDFEIRHHSCFVAIAFLCPDHHVPFCTTETVGSTVWRLTVGWMTWFLQSILQRPLRSRMIQLWLRRHSSVIACQVRME